MAAKEIHFDMNARSEIARGVNALALLPALATGMTQIRIAQKAVNHDDQLIFIFHLKTGSRIQYPATYFGKIEHVWPKTNWHA